jgi:hypothetical protein
MGSNPILAATDQYKRQPSSRARRGCWPPVQPFCNPLGSRVAADDLAEDRAGAGQALGHGMHVDAQSELAAVGVA